MAEQVENNEWDIIVKPKSSLFNLNIKEVWTYKDLIFLMVKRDITAVYKQTILGPVWMIIQPIFTTAIYTFTFSLTAKMSTDNIPPVLFYFMGQVFWTYFSDSLNKTSNTFIANAGVFGKVYFPRLVMPISVVISNLVKLGIQLALLAIIYFYYYATTDVLHPNIYILFCPVFIVFLGVFGLSLGVIFSSLTTKYRDFTFLLGFAVQLIMFASCVVFPLSIYSSKIQHLFMYNPIVTIMEAIRFCLTGNGHFNILNIFVSQSIIVLFLIIGVIMFNKTEKTFMDSV